MDHTITDKFIKGFAMKAPQVIIQSRLRDKVQTTGDATNHSNWFNISIEDYPEILEDTKRALDLGPGDSVIQRLPLCVEISLRTSEGDAMVLEVWTIAMTPGKHARDATLILYNQLCLLTKSLFSTTRQMPAYKFSRRQTPDAYVIHYRIYCAEPEIHCLGDERKQNQIGQLMTSVGQLSVTVTYRTKFSISPTQISPSTESGMLVKSDHFIKDIKSPNQVPNARKTTITERKVIDLNKPMKGGTFVDMSNVKYSEDDYILPKTPQLSWLLGQSATEDNNDFNNNDEESRNDSAEDSDHSEERENEKNQTKIVRKGLTKSIDAPNKIPLCGVPNVWASFEDKSHRMSFPFATSCSPINDLAQFHKECTNAPPLEPEPENPYEGFGIDDLAKKLADFETVIPKFDSLVTSLCDQFDEEFLE